MSETLFHYCSTPTAFAILKSRTFRLSPLSSANDSLEGRLVGETFHELIQTREIPRGVKKVASVIAQSYNLSTEGFAFCMSEEGDILSQWRAYGTDGTGISIGFDSKAFQQNFGEVNFGSKFFELMKVRYGGAGLETIINPILDKIERDLGKYGDFIELSTDVTISEALTGFETSNLNKKRVFQATRIDSMATLEILQKILSELHFKIYATKPVTFFEEKEWRLLRYRHRDAHPEISYDAGARQIRPFINCLVADPAIGAFCQVVLGPKNLSHPDWVRAFLASIGLSHVTVTKSSVKSYR